METVSTAHAWINVTFFIVKFLATRRKAAWTFPAPISHQHLRKLSKKTLPPSDLTGWPESPPVIISHIFFLKRRPSREVMLQSYVIIPALVRVWRGGPGWQIRLDLRDPSKQATFSTISRPRASRQPSGTKNYSPDLSLSSSSSSSPLILSLCPPSSSSLCSRRPLTSTIKSAARGDASAFAVFPLTLPPSESTEIMVCN